MNSTIWRWLGRAHPRFGPRLGLGLLCGALVLCPALLAAELIVRAYERVTLEEVQVRAVAGLDSLAGLVQQEAVRTLNNAEVAAERLGRLVQPDATEADGLVQAAASMRTALRNTSLLAVVDGTGRILASDPASNLPFANSGDVRAALSGRSSVGLQDRAPPAMQAAVPLRRAGEIVPGAVVVAVNVDDGFSNTALRISGLDVAVVQNVQNAPRVTAASRNLRRSLSFASDTSVDPSLLPQSGDIFERARLGADSFLLAGRPLSIGNRQIGTLLVGLPSESVDARVRRARLLAYGAAGFGGLAGGLVGVLLGSGLARWLRRHAQAAARLGSEEPPGPGLVPTRGVWGEAGRALLDADSRVRQSLKELDFRYRRLEAVLASLSEGVIVADAARSVILVNPPARALLSLPAGGEVEALELIGRDQPGLGVDDIVHGNERVIRSYSASVRDGETDELLGSVTVLRDATREQELDRLKSEFLMVVSHELQTPLTAIKGALELVVDEDSGQLTRVQRRFLDTVERNCTRLVGLVGDLLDLSRLEAGRVELTLQPLDTGGVVRGAVAALANLFDERGTTIRLDVPDAVPPILGDRRRVEQILTNLLANAAKYTPSGGHVEVAAWGSNGHVAVAVTDSGPGVPEPERELVFDKFYRGRDALRRGESGSGLGLAIVKSLVELHGGAVRIEDGSGTSVRRGARFLVELPCATDEE